MKASIKFRDDQKPLLRAKVPINILSFPFQSGAVVADSKELSLNLSTNFDYGPCFKFTYKPNDPQNPFGLVCKTGIGHYGSPNSSPFVMSAEFDLVGIQNPRFFVHFKPRLGDFLGKKSCSSVEFGNGKEFVGGLASERGVKNGNFSENGKIGVFPVESAAVTAAAAVGNLVAGMEMSAKTVLPVGKRAAVNFKWGFRVPPVGLPGNGETGSDMVVVGRKGDWTGGITNFKKFCPMLVMNKIGIEHLPKDDTKGRLPGSTDVVAVCLNMKQQLEIIQAENGLLRKALDDLRSDVSAGKMKLSLGGGGCDGGRYKEGERNVSKSSGGAKADRRGHHVDKRLSESNGFGGKGAEDDVNEELKKALMGASGA